MVDKIFYFCDSLIVAIGKLTHIRYNEVNVILFCIIWPLLTIILVLIIITQGIKIKRLKKDLKDKC
jgi:hypothetical protein